MRVLITGPQGSGKTTQARILAQKHSFILVETGGLIRKHAQQDSPESQILKKALEAGVLADNQIVSKMMKNAIEEFPEKDVVVDGYPRDLEQLKIYDPHYDFVFYLDLPYQESYNRLLKRGREDDTPELIKQRLSIFQEETEKTVQHYKDLGKLIVIDARPSIEQVTAEIEKALEK